MAEALINSRSTTLVAHSAGVVPSGYIDPHTIHVMNEIEIDISANRSKSTEIFKEKEIDIVITLCATAYEMCPPWLYQEKLSVHWGFKDVSGKSTRDYRRLRDEIRAHLDRFLALYRPDATDEEIQTHLRRLMR
ncbi:MAG: arsenate reductase [Chlorobiales bacterium]|nr:arsenate reductase [Chlorobiales bacterium]